MQRLNEILMQVDSYIGGSSWFVFILLGTGLFFTFYLGFPQIRFFGRAIGILRGKYDSGGVGDTSHFQALSTALSGTIGTGNIAGVALAIHLGGPPAIFWMMLTAFLGMTTKFVEVTLSHKYRDILPDGSVSGGPMYYMKNKLNMGWLAAIFAGAAILSSFGTGSLPQINSISNAMFASFGIKHYITGLVMSVLMALIIIGGIKRIAQVTERLIPAMSILYIIGAISVLWVNYDNILPSLSLMFGHIFSGTAAMGGFLGATFMWAFNRGVNRGLFSNEAGQGSAPIAHASAKTEEPVAEGMVALLEPFIDTLVICFITGIVIVSSGVWNEKFENVFQNADMVILADQYDQNDPSQLTQVSEFIKGEKTLALFTGELSIKEGKIQNPLSVLHARSFAEDVVIRNDGQLYNGSIPVRNGNVVLPQLSGGSLTITGKSLLHSAPLSTQAFKRGFLGDWGQYIIPICLMMFAFSTAVAWSYYGDRAVTYLWGTKYVRLYHIVYVVAFFIASFTDTTIIWTLSGIAIVLMTLPNLIGILLLHKDMRNSMKDYQKRFIKGE